MPRNRLIKHDFWADEKVGSLTINARMMFVASWNFADDVGVFRGNFAYLKANIFPYDDAISIKNIKEYCYELINCGLILGGNFNGEKYFLVKNFSKHQTINRPSSFRFINDTDKHNITESFISLSTHTLLTEGSLTKVKDKVKDKVKEKEKGKGKDDYIIAAILDLWNRNAPRYKLPSVKLLNATRKKKLQLALKDFKTIDDWRKIFSTASKKGFIGNDGREFVPNWDYVFRNNNWVTFYDEYEILFSDEKNQKSKEQTLKEVEAMLWQGVGK